MGTQTRHNGSYSAGGSRARRSRRRKRMIKAVIAWAVCLLLVGLIAFGTVRAVGALTSSKKQQLRQEGIEKLNSGDYSGAVDSFEQALAKSGKRAGQFNSDVLSYRAEAELFLKDYEAAIHSYDLLLELGKDKATCLYMKSFCYGQLADKDQAVSFWNQARAEDKTKHSAGYEEALIAVGTACLQAEDYETAMSVYEEALKDDAGTEENKNRIYNQMGLCQMAGADYQAAFDSFDKGYQAVTGGAELSAALSAAGDGAKAALLKELTFNRAAAMEHLEQYEEAEKQFQAYMDVFGADEAAEHEIDFLKTR